MKLCSHWPESEPKPNAFFSYEFKDSFKRILLRFPFGFMIYWHRLYWPDGKPASRHKLAFGRRTKTWLPEWNCFDEKVYWENR